VHQIELEMQNEELHGALAEMEASRARYFDLYNLAPMGYCSLGETGLILEANLAAANLLGVTRGALLKRLLFRFIFKEDQDILYRRHKKLFETGEPQAYELRFVKNDGIPVWVLVQATAAWDGKGESVCRVALSDLTERKQAEALLQEVRHQLEQRVARRTEITEREQAEEALRESEQRFATLFHRSPVPAALTRLSDCIILNVNDAYLQLVGYPRGEIIGNTQPPGLLVDPSDSARYSPVIEEKGIVSNFEIGIRNRSGEVRTVIVESEVIDINGERCALTMNIDITERKRSEEEKERLEAQNAQLRKSESLGLMAGAIAHNYNNLLMVVMGNLELALAHLPDGSPALDCIDQSMKASQRAAEISRLMLAYLGHNLQEKKPVDLSGLCRGALPSLMSSLQKRVRMGFRLPVRGFWPTPRRSSRRFLSW